MLSSYGKNTTNCGIQQGFSPFYADFDALLSLILEEA